MINLNGTAPFSAVKCPDSLYRGKETVLGEGAGAGGPSGRVRLLTPQPRAAANRWRSRAAEAPGRTAAGSTPLTRGGRNFVNEMASFSALGEGETTWESLWSKSDQAARKLNTFLSMCCCESDDQCLKDQGRKRGPSIYRMSE